MAERDPALRLRVLSAVALVPIALALVVLGGWAFTGFVELAVLLMALEWARLTTLRHGRRAGWIAGGAVLAVGVASTLLIGLEQPAAAVATLALGAVMAGAIALACGGPVRWTTLGVAYVGLPALALLWLRAVPALGLALILWLLIVIWTTDTAAYFAGRRFGGPRLAPTISPGKTWSGLLGGMTGAALAGAGAGWALGAERLVQAAGLGAGLALIAQVGDLVQSALKRSVGVKDSGRLIPGHGGVLDRVDGLMFAAPALALVSLVLGAQALPWR